jgi:hypothetical protein
MCGEWGDGVVTEAVKAEQAVHRQDDESRERIPPTNQQVADRPDRGDAEPGAINLGSR